MTTIITLDLETSINNHDIGSMKAAPWHEDNFIVIGGVNVDGDYTITHSSVDNLWSCIEEHTEALWVGHNIKFDIHHLWVWDEKTREFVFDNNVHVWDTQLAEYILTGQLQTYPTLDQCSKKYGGTLKDDRIKAMWKAGVKTEDMPEEMLREYLEHDVENTLLVFKEQVKRASELEMMPLIQSQMEALLATTEMEYNGMYFEASSARAAAKEMEVDRDKAKEVVIKAMSESLGIPDPNPASNDQVSLWLFGGVFKYVERVPLMEEDGVTQKVWRTGKNAGKLRFSNKQREKKVSRIYIPEVGTETSKKGFYQVSEEVLKNLPSDPAIDSLRTLRAYEKEISTYLLGYSDLTWGDSRIHHSLNHTSTATGRLSCTKPNLQNVSS